MTRSDRRYFLVVALALVVMAAFVALDRLAPEPPAPVPEAQGWRYDAPPENRSILCAWPREGSPGYWDYYAVVHVGDEWIADVGPDEPTVSIMAEPPVCWMEQP